MKLMIKKHGLPLMLAVISCNVIKAQTIYVIHSSTATPNQLIVQVDRTNKPAATQLVLRGPSVGVAEQVQHVACDGSLLKENKPGVWSVPVGCKMLQWKIPLLAESTKLNNIQQSMKSNNFILLSTVSSLPRLEDATVPETLKFSFPGVKTVFPKPNSADSLSLPPSSAAPFFTLFNPTIVGTVSSGPLNLTYLLDNPKAIASLPSMAAHLKGLRWLNSLMPEYDEEDFTVAWLGISAKRMSLSGAMGQDVLLTNYPNDGKFPLGKPMLLYVAFHEAFHQFSLHYPEQPTWVAESLTAYYGARATQIALPNDPNSIALMKRFEASGKHFSQGLLIINRNVQKGDRSAYGAFYTKGITFWAAVNELLQARGDTLDHYMPALFEAKYDAQDNPINLPNILHLSSKDWSSLRQRFLDAT